MDEAAMDEAATVADVWDELAAQLRPGTPAIVVEAVCCAVLQVRDARRRIAEEGLVALDARGNALEHPAVKIERDAGKQLRDWMKDYGVPAEVSRGSGATARESVPEPSTGTVQGDIDQVLDELMGGK